MNNKARRIPARLQDMREAIANALGDIGTLSKDEFRPMAKRNDLPALDALVESLLG